MKRIFCALSALIWLFCSAAAADGHLGIDGSFAGSAEGTYVTFDLYEQDGQTTAVSSVLSDIAVVPDLTEGRSVLSECSAFLFLRPDMIRTLISTADGIFEDWLSKQTHEQAYGAYSGSLFDHASSVSSCAFPLSGLIRHLRESSAPLSVTEDDSNSVGRIIAYFADRMQEFSGKDDPVLIVRDYDQGAYRTILVTENEGIMMTLSFDRTEEQRIRMLASYKENGRYCFISREISADQITADLISTIYVSGNPYRSADETPLFRHAFRMTDEGESGCSFQCAVEAEGIREPLNIRGNVQTQKDGSAEVRASAGIEGNEYDILRFSLYTETLNRPVSFADKKIRHPGIMEENAEIRLESFSGLMALAAEIYTELPADYREQLNRIVFR